MLLSKLSLIDKRVIELVHGTLVHLFSFFDHLGKIRSIGVLAALLNVLIVNGECTVFVLILTVVLSPL